MSILFALCSSHTCNQTVFASLSQTHYSFPPFLQFMYPKASVCSLGNKVLSLPSPNFCSRSQSHSPGVLHSFACLLPHHPEKTDLILEGMNLPYSSLSSPTGTYIHVKWRARGNSKSIRSHEGSEVLKNDCPLSEIVQLRVVYRQSIDFCGGGFQILSKNYFRPVECSCKYLRCAL